MRYERSRKTSGISHERIGDPMNYDVVHAGTARFWETRIPKG